MSPLKGSFIILPTWDKRNFFSSSIELIISCVFSFKVCLTILEGSIPNSALDLKSVFTVVVVVVVSLVAYIVIVFQ